MHNDRTLDYKSTFATSMLQNWHSTMVKNLDESQIQYQANENGENIYTPSTRELFPYFSLPTQFYCTHYIE